MKSLQNSVCSPRVLGHYWHLLFNINNKDRLFKNHATGCLVFLYDQFYAHLQCLQVYITKSKQV